MIDYVGKRLGNYYLLRLLGQGGFARVYLGEHVFLKTLAAIKVLHTQMASTELDAFLKEAQTIANLEHPHIVRVLDFGIDGYTPFLVMGYAPNGSLRDRHAGNNRPSLPMVVEYVKQAASALQHAHSRQLIHRDVKPENLLLGAGNEVLLTDFGIVTASYSTSRPLQTQDTIGTVAYMAPEQIQGKPRPASDQYALGIVVYEWLSGERPFRGTITELFSQHLFAPPPPLRAKLPSIPPDVESVLFTALAKDPKQRFGAVQAFANALEQAAGSKAPVVPPPRPSVVLSPNPTKPLLGTTLHTYHASGWVSSVKWAPDGKYIAFGTWDNQVQVWSALQKRQDGDERTIFSYNRHMDIVKSLAWSPQGMRIASASWDRNVHVWDSATGSNSLEFSGHASEVEVLAWSPDGKRIASASHNGEVIVWDAVSGINIYIYYGHTTSVWSLVWSPDSRRIASADQYGAVHVWDATSGANVFVYRGHARQVGALTWSPDGKRIASGSRDGTVQVWDAHNGGNVFIYRGHNGLVGALSWSPGGKYIASAVDNVHIWDASNGDLLYTYPGHSDWINALAWSPDGQYIASASDDHSVQIWQAV